MKKNLLIFCLIVLTGVAALSYYLKKEKIAVDFELLTGPDVIFHTEIRDFDDNYTYFKQSKLGRQIKSIDWLKIARDLEIDKQGYQELEKFVNKFDNIEENKLFWEITGKQFCFSIYPIEVDNADSSSPEKAFKDSLVLISKPAHGTNFIKSLASFLPNTDRLTIGKFNGFKFAKYKIDEKDNIYIASVKDNIILTFDKKLCESVVLRYKEKTPTLNGNKGYLDMKRLYGGKSLFYYADFINLKKFTTHLFNKSLSAEELALLENILKSLEYYSQAGGHFYRADNVIHSGGIIKSNLKRQDSSLQKILATPPVKVRTLSTLPENILIYYWVNTFKLKDIFNYFLAISGINNQQKELYRSGLSNFIGMEIESFFSLFDSQFELLVKKSRGKQLLPAPDLALKFSITGKQQFNEMLSRLFIKLGIRTHTQHYKNKKITVYGESGQINLQPAFVYLDDTFILATNVGFLKEFIDNQDKKKTPEKPDSDMAFIKDMAKQKSNGLCYVKNSEILAVIKEASTWLVTLAAIQDDSSSRRATILFEQLVSPLMDGFSMYSVVGYRTWFENGNIFYDSKTLIKTD